MASRFGKELSGRFGIAPPGIDCRAIVERQRRWAPDSCAAMTLPDHATDPSSAILNSQARVPTFAILGVISGVISAIGMVPFRPSDDLRLLGLFVLPGLIFGAIIGPALAYGGWLRPWRVPAWILFATLGHFAAVLCVTGLTWRLQAALPLTEQSAIAIAAALGGALGGGILAGANRWLVPGAGFIAPTIVAGILSPLVLLHDAGPILGPLVFYVIWQAAYVTALVFALPP